DRNRCIFQPDLYQRRLTGPDGHLTYFAQVENLCPLESYFGPVSRIHAVNRQHHMPFLNAVLPFPPNTEAYLVRRRQRAYSLGIGPSGSLPQLLDSLQQRSCLLEWLE